MNQDDMEHTDFGERLVRIETKLDIIIENENDKERRIRRLERGLWYVSGAFAAILFLKDTLIGLIKK